MLAGFNGRHRQRHHRRHGKADSHAHPSQSVNVMPLQIEITRNARVDPLQGAAPVVQPLPFAGVARQHSESAQFVLVKLHPHDAPLRIGADSVATTNSNRTSSACASVAI